MPYDVTAGAVLAALSGVGLALLGFVVLRVDRRDPASLAFSAFALVWGGQLVAANLYRMSADAATAQPWAWLFAAGLVVLYVPLLYFVSAYPWPSNRIAETLAGPLVLATPAAFLLILLGTSPGLFFQRASPTDAAVTLLVTQDLFVVVSSLVSILAFVAALLIAFAKLREATGREERAQLSLVVAAFLFYLGDRAALVLDWGVLNADAMVQALGAVPYAVLVGSAACALAAVGYVSARVLRAPELPWRELVLVAASLPFAAGLVGALVRDAGVAGFDLVGLWRLGMVGLFAYAIARYELFDLELRLRDAAPVAGFLATAGIGLGVMWGGFGAAFRDPAWLGATASLGVIACCYPSMSLTEAAVDRWAPYLDEPEYLYKRKVEVYRGALEEAQAKGMGTESEELFLSDLRRRLGISEEEHRVLMMVLEGEARYGDRPRQPDEEKFEVVEELGRGSFGRARLARDTTLDREVVLKEPTGPWMFDEEGRELFLREARLAARINHPNVVQIYEVLPEREPPMLVLEYVDGGSLADRLAAEGPLDLEDALRVLDDVLEGLERVHEEGMVHRDLKPANILLTQEGSAKVTDLGIAHPPEDEQMVMTLATGDSQPGTVAYMSPEQVRGDPVDDRTDVYAAGAVLHKALTGEHYLDLEAVGEVEARRRIREDVPPLDDERLPAPVVRVLETALAKDPGERFASCEAFREALAQAVPAAEPA